MDMFLRAINTLKVLSLLAFFILLLWIYANLVEDVKFFSPGNTKYFILVSKSAFFYICLLSLVIVNLFLYWFAFFINGRAVVFKVFNALKSKSRMTVFAGWLGGFHFSLNVLLLGVLFYAGLQNINSHSTPDQYNSLLILGSILTLLCIAGMSISVLKHEVAEK
jgi:hypothetical protein